MSVESRVRRELRAAAGEVDPRIEPRLTATVRIEHRRRIARRVSVAVAAAVLVPASVLGVRALVVEAPTVPAVSPTAPAPAVIPTELVGTWRRTIAPEDAPVPVLAGAFTLRLGADGRMELLTTPGFGRQYGDALDTAFRVEGEVLTSGAFFDHCGEPMAYRWRVSGDTLTLSLTGADACGFRRLVFTGGPWVRDRG